MAELGERIILSLEDLESQLGEHRFPAFVKRSEEAFHNQVREAGDRLLANRGLRFVFISGPTSSGKTTFATHFSERLNSWGRKTQLISLDDYYYEGPLRYDEAGRPDYESVDTVELSLLQDQLRDLSKGKTVRLPQFNFRNRRRSFPEERHLKLSKDEIIMVEGLHGLAPEVLGQMDREEALAVFIMPNAALHSDCRTLSPSDIRRLRRISRDVNQRGSPALATLDFWPMVARAEDEFIPKYLAAADIYVNSILPYEFCVIAPPAKRELRHSIQQYIDGELPASPNVREGLFYADLNRAIKEAKRLSQACELIPEVDGSTVPEDSILREFL